MHTPLRPYRLVLALLLLTLAPVPNVLSAQPNAPEGVVAAFLNAWNRQDRSAMYALLSPQSQALYAEPVFNARYEVADEAMRLSGISYSISDVHYQGQTAAVTYDLQIDSTEFGSITDPNRTMRLVNDGSGTWGVAWSSMDILDTMTASSSIIAAGSLPPRETIYDRSGQPIAQQGFITAVWTRRQSMNSETDCAQLMAEITRRPTTAFLTQFIDFLPETDFFLEELNTDTFERFQERIGLTCGISYTRSREGRVYYGNNAMAHSIGYVGPITAEQEAVYRRLGYNSSDVVGQTGVERQYERQLAGTPDRVLRIRDDLSGVVLRELGSSTGSPASPVTTTLDRNLQLATAQAMADAYDYALPNWASIAGPGAAVVLDVNSGEILAMVSYPLINPMLFDRDSLSDRRLPLLTQTVSDPREPLANHAIQNQYSPGSVFKVITAAAILNEFLTAPQEPFNCDLYWYGQEFGDTQERRQDWRVADELPAAGIITPAEAIMSSCNPFFWQYGAVLYRDRGRSSLAEYARQLGLGQAYGLFPPVEGLPGQPEAAGQIPTPPNIPEAINESVGQGSIALPPIQMAVATAAFANGGTVYKPYLVRQVGDDSDPIEQNTPEVMSQLGYPDEVMAAIREGMCGAVTNQSLGTAYRVFRSAPYSVCGKTGTAQTGLYPNAWFIAYAPADDPQIAIVVMVAQSREGSEVAAPITRRILDTYFDVDRVEPFPEWWAEGPYVPLENPAGG